MTPGSWHGGNEAVGAPADVAVRGLDFDELNYLTSLEPSHPTGATSRSLTIGLIAGGVLFFGRWLRAVAGPSRDQAARSVESRVLVGVASHNQRRVVDALDVHDGAGLVDLVPYALVTKPIGVERRFPLAAAYRAAMRQMPRTLESARRSGGHRREAWRRHAAEYALTPGMYVAARRWLARSRPALVMVANDHVMRTRVLLRAARDEGIPTVYVQHASVTDRFPPLSVDVALLDGRDALDKYLSAGPTHARIFLSGSPLHDDLLSERHARAPAAGIGLCLNRLDDRERIVALTRALAAVGERDVEVRVHPRDARPWRTWLRESGVERVHMAQEAPIASFFDRVGVVLAGDSGVHLEAALFGRASVYLGFVGTGADAYGFVRAGLVRRLDDPAALKLTLTAARRSSVPEAVVSRYAASVGTAWSGRSGRLVREVLTALATRAEHPPSAFAYEARVGSARVFALSGRDVDGLGASTASEAPRS